MAASGFVFGEFELDEDRCELRHAGVRLAIEPKPFELLSYLLRHRDRVVSKEELLDAVWKDTAVSDASLSFAVKRLRQVIGDDARTPRFIETRRGRGYRFIGAVAEGLPGGVPLDSRQGIAVLPLENLSGDPGHDFFADGVTEDLISEFGQIRSLRVPSRTTVMQYRGTHKPLPEIAAELGVDHLVEGSVRREGDRVRISVQLLRGDKDEHLWAETYDEDLRDILSVQSRIAHSVGHRVRAVLTPEEETRAAATRLVEPEAYDLYLRGRREVSLHGGFGARAVIHDLKRAVELSPEFGAAHLWLAVAQRCLYEWALASADETIPKVRDHSLRAVELGEELSHAYTNLGMVALLHDRDFAGAKQWMDKAIAVDPNAISSRFGHGLLLMALGARGEGLASAYYGLRNEPLNLVTKAMVHVLEARARRFDEAIEGARAVVALDPTVEMAYLALWMAHTFKGEFDEAGAASGEFARRAGVPESIIEQHQRAYRVGGPRAWLRAFADLTFLRPTDRAGWYAYLGEADLAFQWLETAVRVRDSDTVLSFNMNPLYDAIRSDPRFADLAERLGIPLAQPDGPLVAPLSEAGKDSSG